MDYRIIVAIAKRICRSDDRSGKITTAVVCEARYGLNHSLFLTSYLRDGVLNRGDIWINTDI